MSTVITMAPPPRLSNCYIPVPQINDTKATATIDFVGRRKKHILLGRKFASNHADDCVTPTNQRNTHELRRLRLESSVIQSTFVSGSVLVELGRTKVICTVIGPVTEHCPLVPSSLSLSMDCGTLFVDVKYLPSTGYPTSHIHVSNSIDSAATQTLQQQPVHQKRRLHFVQKQENDLSTRIQTALSAAVPLLPYPKCAILVQFTVLYDDGGILPSCLTAASIALANSGIEMYDTVTAGTVAIVAMPSNNDSDKINSPPSLLADPSLDEISIADCLVTIAMLPNWEEVALWEQQPFHRANSTSAPVPLAVIDDAISLCQDGCRTMHRFIRQHMHQNPDDS